MRKLVWVVCFLALFDCYDAGGITYGKYKIKP